GYGTLSGVVRTSGQMGVSGALVLLVDAFALDDKGHGSSECQWQTTTSGEGGGFFFDLVDPGRELLVLLSKRRGGGAKPLYVNASGESVPPIVVEDERKDEPGSIAFATNASFRFERGSQFVSALCAAAGRFLPAVVLTREGRPGTTSPLPVLPRAPWKLDFV